MPRPRARSMWREKRVLRWHTTVLNTLICGCPAVSRCFMQAAAAVCTSGAYNRVAINHLTESGSGVV